MMSCSWEGNCRSSVTQAMRRVTDFSGFQAYLREMNTHQHSSWVWYSLPLYLLLGMLNDLELYCVVSD